MDENKLATIIQKAFRVAYVYYMVLSIIGIIGYFTGCFKLMYVMTGIILVTYILSFLLGNATFVSGLLFIPLGAVAGYIWLNGIPGACLAILLVFLIRHVIKDIIWTLVIKLLNKISGD